MRVVEGDERPPRPELELTRGEIGLLVWGLTLLQRVVDHEDAPDLVTFDLERLGQRLNDHAQDLDAYFNDAPPSEAEAERPF